MEFISQVWSALIQWLSHGLVGASGWQVLAFTLVVTHITIAAVTIFLHRHQAHRALDLHPAVSHFFRFWLWLTTGMRTREWAAVHRKHHARCETAEDPHSPQILGINRVLWGGVFLYVKEAARPDTIQRFGHGTPDDWLENHGDRKAVRMADEATVKCPICFEHVPEKEFTQLD